MRQIHLSTARVAKQTNKLQSRVYPKGIRGLGCRSNGLLENLTCIEGSVSRKDTQPSQSGIRELSQVVLEQTDWDEQPLTVGDVQTRKVKGSPLRRGGGNAQDEEKLKMGLPYPMGGGGHQHSGHPSVRALESSSGFQSYSHQALFHHQSHVLGEVSQGVRSRKDFDG